MVDRDTQSHPPVQEPPGGPQTVRAKPLAGEKAPRQLSQRGIIVTAAVLAGVIIVALAVFVLFLPPFNLAGGLGYKLIRAGGDPASHPDGISVSVVGEGQMRLRLDSTPREAFLQGIQPRGMPAAQNAPLPSFLELKSPIYTVESRGEAPVRVEIVIPNDAEPYHTLDLYRWDQAAGRWVFVPSHVDAAAGVIRTDELPGHVAVFQTKPVTPLVGTTLLPGQEIDEALAGVLNLVMPYGLELQANFTLTSAPTGGWEPGAGYAVVPVVQSTDEGALSQLLNSPASLALHVQDIKELVASSGYNGIAIDYRSITPADSDRFVAFVSELSAALHDINKVLVVVLPPPSGDVGAWDTGGYNWQAIGAAADLVVLMPGIEPADYAINGRAINLLSWAVGEISRYKIHVASSSLSYDQTGGVLLPYEEAVALLGEVVVEPDLDAEAEGYEPGTDLVFDLSGELLEISPDQNTGAYVYTLEGDGGQRRVWIVTANTMRARLDLLANYHIGGVTIADLGVPGNDSGLPQAITEFKVKSDSTVPSQLVMQWMVSDTSGAVLSHSTGIGTPWNWRADVSGDYTVQGAVVGGQPLDRGSVVVRVAEVEPEETVEPTPTVSVTRAPVTPGPTSTPGPTTTPASTAPPPVAAGGWPAGFALGGQVPGYIAHPNEMKSAGMTWVKFQQKWSPGADPGAVAGMIGAGRANGFKVLLSIPGPFRPSSIDFNSYVQYLRGVASYQPDAIEVWNEMNIDSEWPAGQISPTSYVNNMLAPAYNAIKSVSPGTMVIIGALAPTGFDNEVNAWSDQRYVQGLAAAGAARYADCIGVHHNAGTTSPSVRSGRPEGNHYSWYFLPTLEVYYYGMGGSLPVCLTEFGYVSPEGYGPLPANFSWGQGTTVAQQAAWLAEGATLSRNLGFVRLMIIWNVDFTSYGADPQGGYAIIRPDGSCPACATLGAAMR